MMVDLIQSWRMGSMGDLVDGLSAGVSVRSDTSLISRVGVLKTSSVNGGRFIPDESKPIVPDDIARARCNPVKNSLIISRMNTPTLVGEVGYVGKDFPNIFLPDRLWLARAKRGGQGVDLQWLAYYLSSEPGARAVRGLASGTSGSMKNIPKERLLALSVPIPPLGEQKQISAALNHLDQLISTLEILITKKQAIKEGMMQELLVSRSNRSAITTLGSVTSWLSGGTPDRSNQAFWDGTIPWISATTLKGLEVSSSDQCVTAAGVASGSKMAPVDSTLLLVRGSALHSEIRASLVSTPVCFNQDVKALVPSRSLIPKFLTYSIHGHADELLRLVTSAGNTAGVLDTKVAQNFEFWLPEKTRQAGIINILDDVWSEIDVLNARLAKARSVKQGMMQELLTGRIRLPIMEASI